MGKDDKIKIGFSGMRYEPRRGAILILHPSWIKQLADGTYTQEHLMKRGGTPALAQQSGHQRCWKDVESFKMALVDNLYYQCGQGAHTASDRDVYRALVYTVRDCLTDRFRKTMDQYAATGPKFVYYFSAEYLPGRQISQNLLYAGLDEVARQSVSDFGYDLDALMAFEAEPALGNGGLGRLAACYADALATLDVPSVFYGIEYEFGIFEQEIVDGWQVEKPDDWLYSGYPWEFAQTDTRITVGFGGHTEYVPNGNGTYVARWIPGETVLGEPYHTLVPGFGTQTVNMLRLWRARASKKFDLSFFDVGDYLRAAESKVLSENISRVLYPNDITIQGRELRLKQEYFFTACSMADILRRFLAFDDDLHRLPEKAVIQLNDTHPVVAIPELMRLLLDVHHFEWTEAWAVVTKVFAYTCHTLMPEALEKWPVSLFGRLLPRHLEIIYEINRRHLEAVKLAYPNDAAKLAALSIIEEQPERSIRMAYLATVTCFSVNGVAELHSRLLRTLVLRDFAEYQPQKFNNKTNGVSPRRFIQIANPALTDLIDCTIGKRWQTDLEGLRELEPYADDPTFHAEWMAVKHANKVRLAEVIRQRTGVIVSPDAMFDLMVKRLHEYKRQILQALHIITLYQRLKENPQLDMVPRVFLFGAKAAPGYQMAKIAIKLVNNIAMVVNADPDVHDKLKVVFMPNFNVSLGEQIYPAADLSEQISLAGYEASGTGNMKFALNGALTIGTLDGANIEIRERVGADNFFLFGMTAQEVLTTKAGGYNPLAHYNANPELKRAIDRLAAGDFSSGMSEIFRPVVDALLYRDQYLLLADYPAYMQAQSEVDVAYRDRERWARMSILNSARCGFFSADRAAREYCDEIWHVPTRKDG